MIFLISKHFGSLVHITVIIHHSLDYSTKCIYNIVSTDIGYLVTLSLAPFCHFIKLLT